MTRTFKSKIGLEIVIPVFTVLIAVIVVTSLPGKQINWVAVGLLLPLMVFLIHLFSNTYYKITDNELYIKCGFLYNRSIDIIRITKIKSSRNMLSAPATSLDRLEIRFDRNNFVLVSPCNKHEFVTILKSLNQNIEVTV